VRKKRLTKQAAKIRNLLLCRESHLSEHSDKFLGSRGKRGAIEGKEFFYLPDAQGAKQARSVEKKLPRRKKKDEEETSMQEKQYEILSRSWFSKIGGWGGKEVAEGYSRVSKDLAGAPPEKKSGDAC